MYLVDEITRIHSGGRFLEVWGGRSRNCLNSFERVEKKENIFMLCGHHGHMYTIFP